MKKYLADIYVVWHWFRYKRMEVIYAVKHLGEDYQYIPFIDTVSDPDWLIDLKAEFEKAGIKPVTI